MEPDKAKDIQTYRGHPLYKKYQEGERLRELKDVQYDGESQSFYDGEYRIPDEEVETYLWQRIAEVDTEFSQRVGHSTLRRALATLSAEGTRVNGRFRLVGDDAKAPRPLKRLRYAKSGGEPENSGSGSVEAGGEPAGVSGETGRGRSGQELKAGLERTVQVRQWTEEIRAGWGSRLDVVVHESAEGIGDARLRRAVAEGGSGVEAFFDPQDGRIHLLADRVASKADAERLVRHEGIHWAINGKLGKEYASILDGVRKRISEKEWEELDKSYPEATDHVRVEEYLAYLGQNNPKATAWQSFVYEFKQAVRTIFGKDFEVTDADVLAFLAKANRMVERGERNNARSSFTFSMAEGEGGIRYAIQRASLTQIVENIDKAGKADPVAFNDWEKFSGYSNKQKRDLARKIGDDIRENSQGKILNRSTNHEIDFSKNGLKHWTNYSGDFRKLALLERIDEVVANAVYIKTERPDARKVGDQNIRAYHKFALPISFSRKQAVAKISVQEDANGNWVYDGQIEDLIIKEPVDDSSRPASTEMDRLRDIQRAKINLLQKLFGVNGTELTE